VIRDLLLNFGIQSNYVTKEVTTETATVNVYTDMFNKRIRIDDYVGDLNEVLLIANQQISDWVEKLIVKSRRGDVPFFIAHGFSCEAYIKGYFAGDDMYFVTMYFSAGRERSEKWHEEQSIIQKLVTDKNKSEVPSTEGIKVATFSQAAELARLYKTIFKVYPTPLSEETHIIKTMQEGTVYVYIDIDHQIVSAASAEINSKYKNAELTDCATLPEVEGKGHMKKLLFFLEQKLKTDGITCCYTIARSESFSMNKAFAQLGYTYGGRLVNNCFIYSGLEDMNIWYKA
jgi:beta-lysine N6-acetyltransferase